MKEHEFWEDGTPKPERPKEAFEALLREKRIQRSSAIYKKIATDVSFREGVDPAFLKFKHILEQWFHRENEQYE